MHGQADTRCPCAHRHARRAMRLPARRHRDPQNEALPLSETDRDTPTEASTALVLPAVSVFVFRGDRLLALKRAARVEAAPGAWDVVSGRVQSGEHPYDAA